MLKKKIVCLILVLCAALVLTACGQQQETYPNQPRQDTGAAQQQAPVQEQVVAEAPAQQINFNDGSYDPASEEGGQSEQVVAATNAATAAPVMQSEYAGATPVKIDPVDKPTPTAVDSYTLTNPDPSMDYEATVEIRTIAAGKDYTQKELIKEVKAQADTLRSTGNFQSFDASDTAARFFIDGNGVYLAYKGVLNDGQETGVAGRIIVNTVNKTLYVLHVSYPRGLADTFADGVYNKVRHSMKLTN